MPELPEVEVLVRHLGPLLRGARISNVIVRRRKVLGTTSPTALRRALVGARFEAVRRRGKFLLFTLSRPGPPNTIEMVGHLGMTGRMYIKSTESPLAKHAAVVLGLGDQNFVFEDTRYFGRFTLSTARIEELGPEPLEKGFTVPYFAKALKRSRQSIKVKLLDQNLVAGIGNIYASEALFRAEIPPRLAAARLSLEQVARLWKAIRVVLREAIRFGSTVQLNYSGDRTRTGLFYYGRAPDAPDYYEERLRVYDRSGKPCPRCGEAIRKINQAQRSTYFCPACQHSRRG